MIATAVFFCGSPVDTDRCLLCLRSSVAVFCFPALLAGDIVAVVDNLHEVPIINATEMIMNVVGFITEAGLKEKRLFIQQPYLEKKDALMSWP
jgi:hypothetical protein